MLRKDLRALRRRIATKPGIFPVDVGGAAGSDGAVGMVRPEMNDMKIETRLADLIDFADIPATVRAGDTVEFRQGEGSGSGTLLRWDTEYLLVRVGGEEVLVGWDDLIDPA